MSCSQTPPPESCRRGPSFAPLRSRRPRRGRGLPLRRCCRRTRLPRCPRPGRSRRAPPAGRAPGPRHYCSPPRFPPWARRAAPQGCAGSGAFTLRGEATGGTRAPISLTNRLSPPPPPPTGRAFLVGREGTFRKTGPRSFASQSRALPRPGEVVNGGMTLLSSPPRFPRWTCSKGPAGAPWFRPPAFRVPPGAGPVVQPAGPLGQWLAPPFPTSSRRGLTATVPGPGD